MLIVARLFPTRGKKGGRALVDYKILAVDDDTAALEAVVDLLRGEGYEVHAASSAEEAEELLHRESYHLVITDLVMPGGKNGVELTRIVKENLPQAVVLMVTGHASLQTAVTALKAGAVDYLTKPVDPRKLKGMVAKLLEGRPLYVPNRLLAEGRERTVEFDGMVSRSPRMRAVFEKIELAAGTDTTVLIRGESGTGKELCARSIHKRSTRARGPFIAVHTGAIPQDLVASELFGHERGSFTGAVEQKPGKFEQAQGGTIFLDEINTMDSRTQIGLLRVLESFRFTRVGGGEERTANVRVVAASNRDLSELVAEGRFREDLYYRLNIFPIDLPPLRERRDDIPLLVDNFLEQFATRYKKSVPAVPEETIDLLMRYPWPGNVRELRNVIEQSVILCTDGSLRPELLPRMLHRDRDDADSIRVPIGTRMKDIERAVIARTLEAYRWNKNRTAKVLGISRRSLYNKLERYRIARAEGNTSVLEELFERPANTVRASAPPPEPEVELHDIPAPVPPRVEAET